MDIEKLLVKRPYNDWKKVKKLGEGLDYDDAVNLRYRALNEMGTENPKAAVVGKEHRKKPVEVPDLKETCLFTFPEIRRFVTVSFVRKVIENFQREQNIISIRTGMSHSFISKFVSAARDCRIIEEKVLADGTVRPAHISEDCRVFSLPLKHMGPVAEFVMKSSIHEMFFGEEGRVVFNTFTRYLITALESMTEEELKDTYEFCLGLYGDYMKRYRKTHVAGENDFSEFGQTKEMPALLYERIHELANENEHIAGCKYMVNRSNGGPEAVKVALKKISSEENRDAGEYNAYEPRVEFFMFFALETGQAMDYFLKNDYINIQGGFTPNGPKVPRLRFFTLDDGKEREITNPDILRILSFSLGLDGDEKMWLDSYIIDKLLYKQMRAIAERRLGLN